METKIKFQEISDDEKTQLVFVKKYRQYSKEYQQQKETKYVFYRANIVKEVSEKLEIWLVDNIKKVDGKHLIESNTSENGDNLKYVDLSTVERWGFFKDRAFTITTQDDADLFKIKSNLIAYIVYIKNDENDVVGYVRKITPSSVLNQTGRFKLLSSGSVFNEIKEDKGIKIGEHADVIFRIENDISEGVIIDEPNFNSIFDMYEQQENESIKILNNIAIISDHPEKDEIESIVRNDRRIQKMLINPIVEEHMNEITFEIFRILKQEIPETLLFDVDESNKQIIFPEDDKKKAIRDFIKVIGWRYLKSLDLTHIIEGTPAEIIK